MTMLKKRNWILIFGIALMGAAAQPALAITVDGLVGDWGISPGPYSDGPSQWTPAPGIFFVQEDQDPAVDFLGPGNGGQNYDAEALYFLQEESTAYFLIVSGFPRAGRGSNTAGDLAIDFGNNGSYEFGVKILGSNHPLFGSPTFNNPTLFPASGPLRVISGTNLGNTQFGYQSGAYSSNTHYAYEIGVPVAWFGSFWPSDGSLDFSAHWTMKCGNDEIDLAVQHSSVVPEPGSLLLIGSGLLGLAFRRRRLIGR